MKSSGQIIKVYSTVNPAEIAVLENEFLEAEIEYRINDDTNFLSGLSLQLIYIHESDLPAAAEIIARLYGEGVLTDPGPGLPAREDAAAVEAAARAQDLRIRRDETAARGPMLRKFLLYAMLFAGSSLMYRLFKWIGLF